MQNPEFKAEFFKNMKRSGTKPEQALAHFFTTYDLKYEAQYVINYNDLVRIYDFYLPEYNVLIEYDGDFWHRLPEQKVNDQIKNEIADSLNYKLVRISGVNNLDFVWDIQYKFI
jgi:G:T-mismatch repair DNA endonuclease (very short patch repair protein)